MCQNDGLVDSKLLENLRNNFYIYDGEHIKESKFAQKELKADGNLKYIAIDPNMMHPYMSWYRISALPGKTEFKNDKDKKHRLIEYQSVSFIGKNPSHDEQIKMQTALLTETQDRAVMDLTTQIAYRWASTFKIVMAT